MKKAILTVAMVSSSVFAHAQYVNGIFTTQIKNGVGVEVTMSFEADSTKIVNSQTYATFFKQSNVPLYAEKNPELDSLELLIDKKVFDARKLFMIIIGYGISNIKKSS